MVSRRIGGVINHNTSLFSALCAVQRSGKQAGLATLHRKAECFLRTGAASTEKADFEVAILCCMKVACSWINLKKRGRLRSFRQSFADLDPLEARSPHEKFHHRVDDWDTRASDIKSWHKAKLEWLVCPDLQPISKRCEPL